MSSFCVVYFAPDFKIVDQIGSINEVMLEIGSFEFSSEVIRLLLEATDMFQLSFGGVPCMKAVCRLADISENHVNENHVTKNHVTENPVTETT